VRILGIDPGSRYCGYGVVERVTRSARAPRGLAYVECGVLEPQRQAPLASRLAEIGVGLREVIAELRPDAVAVEGVFHGRNARSALQLGHSRGVALACAGEAGLSVFEYAPATVKRSVAGSGAATKLQVLAMVRTFCALRRAPRLDASDALAVAICHLFHARLRVGARP
jgi:crossover junction endodeoxyribonuclease RuvC